MSKRTFLPTGKTNKGSEMFSTGPKEDGMKVLFFHKFLMKDSKS